MRALRFCVVRIAFWRYVACSGRRKEDRFSRGRNVGIAFKVGSRYVSGSPNSRISGAGDQIEGVWRVERHN